MPVWHSLRCDGAESFNVNTLTCSTRSSRRIWILCISLAQASYATDLNAKAHLSCPAASKTCCRRHGAAGAWLIVCGAGPETSCKVLPPCLRE
jgi:hypothetical protein